MNNIIKQLEKEADGTDKSEAMDAYRKIWELSARMESPPLPEPEQRWLALRTDMRSPRRTPRGLFGKPFVLVPALGGMVVVALGALIWFFTFGSPPTYVTQAAQQHEVVLPDRSRVTLHASSQLSLSRGFNRENRTVSLAGEAWFAVEKGEHAFVIEMGAASIRVLGTQFNVYARDGRVEVGVSEGIVSLEATVVGESRRVRLEGGQRSAILPGEFPSAPQPLDLQRFPDWKSGVFMLDNISLAQVCREIERRFGVTVHLADPSLAPMEVKGLIKSTDARETIQALCILLGRDFRQERDVFTIE